MAKKLELLLQLNGIKMVLHGWMMQIVKLKLLYFLSQINRNLSIKIINIRCIMLEIGVQLLAQVWSFKFILKLIKKYKGLASCPIQKTLLIQRSQQYKVFLDKRLLRLTNIKFTSYNLNDLTTYFFILFLIKFFYKQIINEKNIFYIKFLSFFGIISSKILIKTKTIYFSQFKIIILLF